MYNTKNHIQLPWNEKESHFNSEKCWLARSVVFTCIQLFISVVEVIQKPSLTPQPVIQTITNGFDKATALLLEEGPHSIQDSKKRGHIPSVMRSGTREVHNKLEKNRRAHLKKCFEVLKKQLPLQQDEKKTSNLSILHSALRHIQVRLLLALLCKMFLNL